MKIDYQNAKKVCATSEFELLRSSRPVALKNLTELEIKKQAKIAKKLHQRWKEQSIRQANAPTDLAERSRHKRDLFGEALARFESRLSKIEEEPGSGAVEKSNASLSIHTPPFPDNGKIERPDLASRSEQRARIASHRTSQSGVDTRIKGHVSGQGRRRQAARHARMETARAGGARE